jgi:hypothetical protein
MPGKTDSSIAVHRNTDDSRFDGSSAGIDEHPGQRSDMDIDEVIRIKRGSHSWRSTREIKRS